MSIPDGPAALPDAILVMAFVIISKVIGSLGPSTGLSSDRSSGFKGTQRYEDAHNALSKLLSLIPHLAPAGLHYS